MTLLVIGVLLFACVHLSKALAPSFRADMQKRLGENAYKGIFSLLILGAILDIFSAIVLVVPLILPIAAGFGVDEVHLGIVFLAAMQLGYLTPPVGLNLFIASYRFEKPIMHVYSATFPFLVILMLSVILITFWPTLSLVFV